MGGSPWIDFVPYEKDVASALQKLRQKEFNENWASDYKSIDDVLHKLMEGGGTGSALDMVKIGNEAGLSVCGPMPKEWLDDVYGTTKPTREMVDEDDSILETVERGYGYYFFVYVGDFPREICFFGCSWD